MGNLRRLRIGEEENSAPVTGSYLFHYTGGRFRDLALSPALDTGRRGMLVREEIFIQRHRPGHAYTFWQVQLRQERLHIILSTRQHMKCTIRSMMRRWWLI